MYRGSLVGAGSDVFAVWGYVIANTRRSVVELNPVYLSKVIGESVERMEAAIKFLCRPDPNSTNGKDHEGRRLVKEGTYQYFVPNWELYRRMKDETDRREYNRIKQSEYRSRSKSVKSSVSLAERLYEKKVREGEETVEFPVAEAPAEAGGSEVSGGSVHGDLESPGGEGGEAGEEIS